MNAHIRIPLAALLALATLGSLPSSADDPSRPGQSATAATMEAYPPADCQPRTGQRLDIAQGMPVDCCKGHKGVCGCRAGKIVCCDGTVSKDPNCTCHSDWGIEN